MLSTRLGCCRPARSPSLNRREDPGFLRSSNRRVICATIPIRRSPHAPPDSAVTRLSDARCSFRNLSLPAAYTAATDPDQRTDRLHHEDREKVSSCHLPLSVQEQDPHFAERCKGAGIDSL